jgi:Putative F0F1-ATPase subunit Ca2+/Mg2+ transporter
MKKAAAHPTQTISHAPAPFTAGAIGLQFLDTTWRMAVPVILLAAIGIYADRHLGTKPWLTLLATVLGFGVAVLLVRLEIRQVNAKDGK